MTEHVQTNPTDSTYVIKCVKAGNSVEVYYAFLFEREFWAQLDHAAHFDDLTMAITKLDSIAADEMDEEVFKSLREQLEADVAALYVIRTSDGAIMHAKSFWDENAQVPDASKSSDAFLLKVVREQEDDTYINVDEDAQIALTVIADEATRYGNVNLVRQIIQQLQDASIGDLALNQEAVFEQEGEAEGSDGWSQLKLALCKRPVDYTQGVVVEEDGSPLNTLQMHERVTLEIFDVNLEQVVETHLLRTVVMVSAAHHFALRVMRESFDPLWLNRDGAADDEFIEGESLSVDSAEGQRLLQYLVELETDHQSDQPFAAFQALKIRLLEGSDRVWVELVDLEAELVVSSVYLKVPFYMEPVKL